MKTYSSDILRTNPVGCLGVSWRGTHRSRKMSALGRGRGIPGLGSGVESSRAGNLLMNSTVNTDVSFLQNGPLNIFCNPYFWEMHFHQSGWAPPKMTSAVHRAAGFQVPSASQSENARLVFCTLGAPWINLSKNTWGCSFASCNKKQHMQPMYLRKTWNLGISIYIWRHQLQDFNAQVASFAANRGVDRWIYHLSPVRQWNRPSGGSLSWGNVFFAASTFDVLFPCKWHSCVFA